jgi:hypothetical protein
MQTYSAIQDTNGNWWGIALAARSGPEWEVYSKARETILLPMTGKEGEYPVSSTVRGKMSGWRLPKQQETYRVMDHFNEDRHVYDFESARAARTGPNKLSLRSRAEGRGATVATSKPNIIPSGISCSKGGIPTSEGGRVRTSHGYWHEGACAL